MSLSRSPIAVCTIYILHSEGDDLEGCLELLSLRCLRHSWIFFYFFLKTVWSHSERRETAFLWILSLFAIQAKAEDVLGTVAESSHS